MEARGELEGVKVCRDAPTIYHLLFVDDSFILMLANKKNVDCLASIIEKIMCKLNTKYKRGKVRVFSFLPIQKLR